VFASKRKQHVSSDQVTTELFPHHARRSSPGLVEVKLIFGHLFGALQHPAQAAQVDTSVGTDTQPTEGFRCFYAYIGNHEQIGHRFGLLRRYLFHGFEIADAISEGVNNLNVLDVRDVVSGIA
jgi:hypothetical protein